MRKSVILIILVIFVSSFFVVGFYGTQMKIYDTKVKVEAIVCQMVVDDVYDIDTAKTEKTAYKNLKDSNGNDISYVFQRLFTLKDVDNGVSIVLKFGVDPPTATNKNIRYSVYQSGADENSSSDSAETVEGSSSDRPSGKKFEFTDNHDGSATFLFKEPFEVDVLIVSSDNASNAKMLVRIAVLPGRDYLLNG